jgi:hypothetical protein
MARERNTHDKSEEFRKGFSLADRVKGTAKHFKIDSRVALERFVSESILWALQEVSDVDFMVKGGLLHDQRDRATGDADILFFNDRSAIQLYADVTSAASLLRKSGFIWSPSELQALDMGGRGKGFRVPVECKLGGTRVRTHVDISFGDLPEGAVRREFRSMFKGPSFIAWAQPLEAQAADKLAAVIALGMSNSRLKDYRDLLHLSRMDLSTNAVAKALHATMRERNADTSLLIAPIPDGLSFDYVDEKQWDWRAFAAPQGLTEAAEQPMTVSAIKEIIAWIPPREPDVVLELEGETIDLDGVTRIEDIDGGVIVEIGGLGTKMWMSEAAWEKVQNHPEIRKAVEAAKGPYGYLVQP